jgi:hypothetical protein
MHGTHEHEIPLLKCAAIPTFWWFGKEEYSNRGTKAIALDSEHRSWLEVSNVLGVPHQSACIMVHRAIQRAKDKENTEIIVE